MEVMQRKEKTEVEKVIARIKERLSSVIYQIIT